MEPSELKYDENGLIPAIVQDVKSGQVLMVAYMNKESVAITLAEKRTCFYSRSRRQLWRKGESSGNVQHLVSLSADCDGDALLARVEADGPACHTGRTSCFFNTVYQDADAPQAFRLQMLYDQLRERKQSPKEGSYTSYLFGKGIEKILKKVGEESAEVLIGAMKNHREETVFEIADLCYHVMVLMAAMDIEPQEIIRELQGRHVVDKKVKQETMR